VNVRLEVLIYHYRLEKIDDEDVTEEERAEAKAWKLWWWGPMHILCR